MLLFRSHRGRIRVGAIAALAALLLAAASILILGSVASAPASESTVGAAGWGSNAHGQLGDGTTTSSNAPVAAAGLRGVIAVAAGGDHSLALLSNGTVMAWGENESGQLGNGTTTDSSVPVAVSGLTGVTAIAAGAKHSLARLGNGTVMAWGENASGQLGDGGIANSDIPVAVSGLSGVTSIAAGGFHSLALLENGTVMAWGDDASGQLGNGTTTNGEVLPVPVSGLSGVSAIAGGGYHSLAALSNGTVMAWGLNSSGQLGDATTASSDVPVAVSGLSGVTAVAGGGRHSLALLSGGTVEAWGDNSDGQLGNATKTNSDVPVAVSGLSGALSIAAGAHHSLALVGGGSAMAWGSDAEGQLGNASNVSSDVPVAVGAKEIKGIAAGETHSLLFGPLLATVTAVSPTSGSAAGGTTVTISGFNFTGATAVKFGEASASSFKVTSEDSITATSPAGTGIVDVTVTTPTATSAKGPGDHFSYAPSVTEVKPDEGPQAGGTSVTITGVNLTGVTAVKFGATNAATFKVNSESSIAAVSPAGVGVQNVTVTGPGGTSPTSTADRFTYTGVPPELGRCKKVSAGSGRYGTAACDSAQAGGRYEWLPGVEAGKAAFTTKAGSSVFLGVGATKIACKSEGGKGEYTGPKTVGGVVLIFHDCVSGKAKCASASAKAGEIVTNPLQGALQWEHKAEGTVVLDLLPATAGQPLAQALCETTELLLTGSVIAPLTTDKMQASQLVKFTAAKGLQSPTEYESSEGTLVKDFLQLGPEGKPEQAGLSMKMTSKGKGSLEVNSFT